MIRNDQTRITDIQNTLKLTGGKKQMGKENILVIKTCKRKSNADFLQKILTEFGCIIKTRLGLHEAGNICSDEGLIILQLTGDSAEAEKLEQALNGLDGISFKSIQI